MASKRTGQCQRKQVVSSKMVNGGDPDTSTKSQYSYLDLSLWEVRGLDGRLHPGVQSQQKNKNRFTKSYLQYLYSYQPQIRNSSGIHQQENGDQIQQRHTVESVRLNDKQITDAGREVIQSQKHVSMWKQANTKEYTLYSSICMKIQTKAIYSDKNQIWLPGLGQAWYGNSLRWSMRKLTELMAISVSFIFFSFFHLVPGIEPGMLNH